MSHIRRAVGEDPWAARYALLKAAQRLDLRQLNELLDECLEAAESPQWASNGLLNKLLEERWG